MQVGDKCLLRTAALRVFTCKPSSTPVERLWNVFGDNLTSKRRCISKGMLANLVYARMNMHMLPNDWLPFDTQVVGSLFKSLFDSAEELDDQGGSGCGGGSAPRAGRFGA